MRAFPKTKTERNSELGPLFSRLRYINLQKLHFNKYDTFKYSRVTEK